MFWKIFFEKDDNRNIDSKARMLRLYQIVRETNIFPEGYLIEIALNLGVAASEINELISGNLRCDDFKHDKWCIQMVVFTIMKELTFVDNNHYKKLVNIVYAYGYTIDLIEDSIRDYTEENMKRRN